MFIVLIRASFLFVGLLLFKTTLADTKVFVTNQGSNTVSVFSFDEKLTLQKEIPVGVAPAGVAVSKVNREVYVSNTESSEVTVIDVDSLQVKKSIKLSGSSLGIAVSKDGKKLFVADWFNDCLVIINLDSHENGCLKVGQAPAGISVSSKKDELYVASRDSNSVFIVSTSREKVIGEVMVGDHPFGIRLTPTEDHLFVTNVQSNDISIIDLKNRKEISRVQVGKKPYCVTFSLDGKRAFVTNQYSDSISVINTDSFQVERTLTSGSFPEGIDTYGSYIFFVNWLDEELVVIDTKNLEVVDYAITGSNPRNFGSFIFQD